MRALPLQVLMHAGAEGFMVRDIIRQAAEMRIVDWENSKGKKSHVSGCISKEKRFVHVGGWKCALPRCRNLTLILDDFCMTLPYP